MTTPATRRHHNKFCQVEGWRVTRQGEAHQHIYYEFGPLPNQEVLYSSIKLPLTPEPYGPYAWKSVLQDQLKVREQEFWACVRNQKPPDRGGAAAGPPAGSLPLGWVVTLLQLGVPEAELRNMTVEDLRRRIRLTDDPTDKSGKEPTED